MYKINPNITALESYITAKQNIRFRCNIDGNEWKATPDAVLHGSGCSVCNESRGEKIVKSYLDEHNISYVRQKTFDGCKSKYVLPFDFYLVDSNICIEYDGIQHFSPIERFGGEAAFRGIVERDNIKTQYCKDNGIVLLRIRYDQDAVLILDQFCLQYDLI